MRDGLCLHRHNDNLKIYQTCIDLAVALLCTLFKTWSMSTHICMVAAVVRRLVSADGSIAMGYTKEQQARLHVDIFGNKLDAPKK